MTVMHAIRKGKTEDASVVDHDHDDGERTEEIETGLALTISKTRIDYGFAHTSSLLTAEIAEVTEFCQNRDVAGLNGSFRIVSRICGEDISSRSWQQRAQSVSVTPKVESI
jgi:hypothetical protein